MKSLVDEVQMHLDFSSGNKEEPDLKIFTVRLPIEMIEKMESIGGAIGIKRTEVARMILKHGIEEIIEQFQMKFESFGVPFEDLYDFETGEKTLEEVLKEDTVDE